MEYIEGGSNFKSIKEISDSDKILYVVDKAMNSHNYENIDRLQIVKLLYMLDIFFKERTGERFTNYNYEKWQLGPFVWDIVSQAEALEKRGFLIHPNSYYQYDLIKLPENFDEVKALINKIIQEHGLELEVHNLFEIGKTKSDLLDLVESRSEVKGAKFREKINI